MTELIHEHSARVEGDGGERYTARIMGARRADGTWEGWIEFRPERGGGEALRTGAETSQPDRAALDYWAGGIEPLYLEGALARAKRGRG